MISKNNEWELKQREQLGPLKNKWLQDMLFGNGCVSQEELRLHQEEFGIRVNLTGTLRLLLIRIDRYREFIGHYNEKDRWLMKFGIANIVNEIVSKEYNAEAIYLENDQFGVLVDISPSESAETTEAGVRCKKSLEPILLSLLGLPRHVINTENKNSGTTRYYHEKKV